MEYMENDIKIPCHECLCFPMCKQKFLRELLKCQYLKNYLGNEDITYKYDLLIRYFRYGFI